MQDIFFRQAERDAREDQQEEQKKEQKRRHRRSHPKSTTSFSEALESNNSDELLQSTISEFMENSGPNVPEYLTPVSPRHSSTFNSSSKSTGGIARDGSLGGSKIVAGGGAGRRRRVHNPTGRTLKAPYTGLNGLTYTLPREKVRFRLSDADLAGADGMTGELESWPVSFIS